jgi:two-component system sensor histidine kinase CiaH
MLIFWLISIGISFFLSHLFMRPILKSWKKQQEFVENASHELRTPLTIVQNKLELLFTKPEEKIIDHSREIGEGLSEIRRLRQLTTDLLTLARSDIQVIVKKESVNVKKLIENLVSNYQLLGKIEDKKVTLEVANEFPKEIITDKKLIQQLLVILLDNALKYTKKQENVQVVLEESKTKGWSFTVKDTGIGIPDKKKAEIFERFTRVDLSRNRDTGGFGLGLSNC